MTPQDLIIALLGDEPRIAEAVSAGAGWEIWMQVEFVLLARARGWGVARETPYPDSSAVLDFILMEWEQRYAVELKVESATNSGRAVVKAFIGDVVKLRGYKVPRLAARYAVGIGYSDQAAHAMEEYAKAGDNRAYGRGRAIAVLVETVPMS